MSPPAAEGAAAPAVLVVGAGPVGRALQGGLARAGVPCGAWSRSLGPPPVWATPPALAVLAVRDDAIAPVAAALLSAGTVGPGTVLLHCAGARPPEEVLAVAEGRVRGLGLLHPLRSLSGPAPDLGGAVMAVAGDEAGRAEAERLARVLGGRPLPLRSEQLAAYHGAAALCAGHAAALLSAGTEVLAALGLDRRAGERALAELLGSMVENVLRAGLPEALTGPMARGDVETVRRHLRALPEASPTAARLYRALAPRVLDLAEGKGAAGKEAISALRALLVLES